MASDSPRPPGAGVSPDLISALSAALVRQLESGESHSEEVRRTLGALAREARDRQLRPEQLLAALHEAWDRVAGSRGARDESEDKQLRERLAAICIEQYFALGLAMLLVNAVCAAAS